MSRDIFLQIGASKAGTRSNNFNPGKGRAVVRNLKYFAGNDGPTFVGELKILSSSSNGSKDEKGALFEPNTPGSTVGYVQKITKFKSAPGNVKAFVLALLGYNETEVTPDEVADTLAEITADAQPCRGMLIDYETYQQVTRSGPNAGMIAHYPRFFRIEQTSEEIAKSRATLEKSGELTDEVAAE